VSAPSSGDQCRSFDAKMLLLLMVLMMKTAVDAAGKTASKGA
jgi:hypothetical protein